MFVDTAKVRLQAGKGGDGAVSFRHEIYIPKGGPDGGDGGKGGSIIFRADKDTNTLLDFRFNPEIKAENGKNGAGQRAAGRSGKDRIIEVPIGTVVMRADDGAVLADLTHDGEEAVIARGGDGGFGNAHFKSSVRQTPVVAEVGEPGEAFEVALELKLMADIGLVGLPNAGKSTFLSRVSNARPEIADYPFTTLTPQLGVATIDGQDLLIADIPGLIEGAADGKGLGHDFLRHVDRTAVLLHLVDVYNDDAGAAYATIRRELEQYGALGRRPEIVALTKCEGVDDEIIAMQKDAILQVNPNAQIFAISSASGQGVKELLRALVKRKSQTSNIDEASATATGQVVSESTAALEQVLPRDDAAAASATDLSEYIKAESGQNHGPNTMRDSILRDSPTLINSSTSSRDSIPVITLGPEHLSKAWRVEKTDDKFIVTGPKIEKFARRTDLNNYASVNRLRDILKKLGIRAELTNQGATPESIISIAGKEFPLVEDY